ncbi:MAG: DPP IV N-terminal domain-containing protein [Verrucomicrobiales bacterium]|nr:DPP IV N-terminal domain-containing protein [Verrucomicrobiales bacterium]
MRASYRWPGPILALAFLVPGAWSQGSHADYERALSLRERTNGKLFRARVRPQWLPDRTGFWYRNDLAGDTREFILVDARQGARRRAFDHERLARALGEALERPVDPARLPLQRLEFATAGEGVAFGCEGRRWEWRDREGVLRPLESGPADEASLPAGTRIRPSAQTGEETSLTFVNRLEKPVGLFWVDSAGARQPYGTIAAGASRAQHTFAGHVWLVTDESGATLAVFEAVEEGGEAVVDGNARERPERARSPERPRRSGRSPDGRWALAFENHNVRLEAGDGPDAWPLTDDGSAGDEYSGRVYWSPDSRRVVVLRTTRPETRQVHLIESSPTDQLQPKLHTLDYAKPGDPLPVARVALFDPEGRRQIPVSDALFTNAWSLSDFHWSPDGREFSFLYNRRGHQLLRVLAVDAETGEVRPVVEETSPTFIDYAHKAFLHHLDATGELIWMSERDGWNHLHLYDAVKGVVKNQITRGEWVVRSVERVDEEGRQIWFFAGGIVPGQDPYHLHLCRVNFDGSGLAVLTAGDGNHTVEFSPDRRLFLDTWSRVDLPPVVELRRCEDGGLVCEIERADVEALWATGWRPPERLVAAGRDGVTDIYGVIYRPSNFDPGRQYPVIECIYAGPQSAYVPKSFGVYRGQQALAELGFIVVQIDGMGTSHRSKAFHDVCASNLGDAGFPDRIAWLKAAAALHPELDLSRVGIYGGSAGGQNALRGLLAHGDFYQVGVADCGCHDNRMDKVWWNELWMGWPVGDHYAEQSNVTQAHRLQGRLMLVVGELDRNVDPSSTLQVVNALIQADKDFDLLYMTGTGHGAAEGPYANRRRMDFFVRHLLGVEPRWEP